MENEVVEKMELFLQNLRCEDVHRTALVHLESCKFEQEKLSSLQKNYESLLENKDLLGYVEQLWKTAFAEQQEAYLQGMIDAFQILCGIGMLSTNENVKRIIEKLKNSSSK